MLPHVVGHHGRDRVRVEPHPFGSRCFDPGLTCTSRAEQEKTLWDSQGMVASADPTPTPCLPKLSDRTGPPSCHGTLG